MAVLPSPTIYYLYKEKRGTAGEPEVLEEANPLASRDQDIEDAAAQSSLPRLARMKRESKDTRAQNESLKAQNRQLQAQISTLKAQRASHRPSPDLDVGYPSNEALEAMAASKQAAAKDQAIAMKELATDESLGEEARELAKQTLNSMAEAQIKEAQKQSSKQCIAAAMVSEEMAKFLESHRLQHHADALMEVAGM